MSRRRGFLAESLERVFGGSQSESPSPRLDTLGQYQKAVEIVGTDGELSEAELRWLGVLEHELDLSQHRAAGVEREVMGATKEEIVVRADGADRYTIAVGMAWADKELNGAEKDWLGRLESELGLGEEQAARIEREVMGATRKEIKPPDPSHPELERLEDNEPWKDLVKECVEVLEEFERDRNRFDEDDPEWKVADNAMLRLQEVLESSFYKLQDLGAEVIRSDTAFDPNRHIPVGGRKRPDAGTAVAETVNSGFAVGMWVARRARVRMK